MNGSPSPDGRTIVRTQSVTLFSPRHPFRLDSGQTLAPVTVAYERYGELNAACDNVILVCHALTGSAHAAGFSSPDDRSAGWWDPMIGPGRPLDTSRYCVICSNFLGGCYGTTGPLSADPRTGRPYGMSFPEYTVRDMVRLQKALIEHLGVTRLQTVIGGSLGGMQVLEWAILYPDVAAAIIPIATAARHSPWCIGLNDLARRAIMLDPAWRGGAYEPNARPEEGLSIARGIAMMSYRSEISFLERFGRAPVTPADVATPARGAGPMGIREGAAAPFRSGAPAPQHRESPTGEPDLPRFQVERYLRYQGKKLVDRFDANTYLYITRAMDSHDIAAGRSAWHEVLGSLSLPALCVGISSDILYPAREQREIAAALPRGQYREIDAPFGHDSFLIAYDQLGGMVREFLGDHARV